MQRFSAFPSGLLRTGQAAAVKFSRAPVIYTYNTLYILMRFLAALKRPIYAGLQKGAVTKNLMGGNKKSNGW